MENKKTGRNDPCPCGSGLKYKRCCLGRRHDPPEAGGPGQLHHEIRQALEGHDFESLEDAKAFLADYAFQRNPQPLEDFAGLSSDRIHRFLYYPFDSPDLVQFPEILAEEPAAPILTLFHLLVEAIGDQGLKTTANGNLPRNFCREAALVFLGQEGYAEKTRYGNLNKEADFSPLHVTRLVAEMAGLVRKYKGRFILSRECRSLLAKGGLAAVYPRLLRTYAAEFNWGYQDGYPEIYFLQHSFLFTLYLLHRYGDEERSSEFYEDLVLRAFPLLVNEGEAFATISKEDMVRSCFTLRALVNFAYFLGLATAEPVEGDRLFIREYRVKKTPLLDRAVQFSI
jgi:hypothetical protein